MVAAAMKPIPTLSKPLKSVDIKNKKSLPAFKERTDSCSVPSASIVGEAMLALALCKSVFGKIRRRFDVGYQKKPDGLSQKDNLDMSTLTKSKANFGTAPVFFTAISTIMGAILFLRFGYAVGNVGMIGTLAIVLIGHLVTIPTALAIAEIATNQKVEGGGIYYIISRSFGLVIGSAIGFALYLSQAISVSFYVIAFAESFEPIFDFIQDQYGFFIDKRVVSIPATLLILYLMGTRGAVMGMKALYVVVAVLFVSLVMFFLGQTQYATNIDQFNLTETITSPDNFFYVFAICFPAFTGMAAGVGLSGDLRDPKRSIPIGTLAATVLGMVIYICVALKLGVSASPDDLATDQFIMSRIAIWGPIIPIGLACACMSSAMGSILIAPRTLQALAGDGAFPNDVVNSWLSKSRSTDNEPINAYLVTSVLAMFFVIIGDVNFVAEIISMFFMVSYGAICLISFLEHFAADPAYRPTFKSRWYFSLLGAVMCFWIMFQMNTFYAIFSLILMVVMYFSVSYYTKEKKGMAEIFQGVIFQLSRQLQVFLQKADKGSADAEENWRPSVVCLSKTSFERFSAMDLLRWISLKYGFGTYIHFIEGYFSKATNKQAEDDLARLKKLTFSSKSNVYLDTLISTSFTSAISQVIQLPGVSGKDNNMILFEYPKNHPEELQDILENFQMIKSAGFDACILGSSDKGFGYNKQIHIWITSQDYQNANLMILLGYIILGHKEWTNGFIKIFTIFPKDELTDQRTHLSDLIKSGRLPISAQNIQLIEQDQETDAKQIINNNSQDADLTIIGFRAEALKRRGVELFEGFEEIGNVLFVNTTQEKEIK